MIYDPTTIWSFKLNDFYMYGKMVATITDEYGLRYRFKVCSVNGEATGALEFVEVPNDQVIVGKNVSVVRTVDYNPPTNLI